MPPMRASTLEKVTEARAAATSVNINAEELNEETLANFRLRKIN